MNVFAFELKREWKRALSGMVVLGLLFVALMAAVYPVYLDSRPQVQAVLDSFPPEFAAAFGLSLDDIFSYGGFYAFCSLYLSLYGAVVAAMLGLSIFAREKRSKCMDFLLAKPRSRATLFSTKLAVALTLLLAMGAVQLGLSLYLYRASPQAAAPLGHALLAFSALLWTELLFLSIAVFVAVFARRVRSVSATAMSIGFGGFILTAVHSLLQEDALRYIAPMKYFDVQLAFAQGRFETPYVLTAALLSFGLLALSFLRYTKSDVHAV